MRVSSGAAQVGTLAFLGPSRWATRRPPRPPHRAVVTRPTEDPGVGILIVRDLPSTLAWVLTAKCFASKLLGRALPEGGRGLREGVGTADKWPPLPGGGPGRPASEAWWGGGGERGRRIPPDQCPGEPLPPREGSSEQPRGSRRSGCWAGGPGTARHRAGGWRWQGLDCPSCPDHIVRSPFLKERVSVPLLIPWGKGLLLLGCPVLGGG